jgi:hypothetical protein
LDSNDTIHYLASQLPNHTTLLVTAEQVGLLGEYFTLARFLQVQDVGIDKSLLLASGDGRDTSS